MADPEPLVLWHCSYEPPIPFVHDERMSHNLSLSLSLSLGTATARD